MSAPFLRPPEIHVEAILLVGYRLYPCARVELHPRLTLLAGGNGVGKTTILDAIQTVLLADQRYIHFNVASGQNDRDLGGQLGGRVAWAVLHLCGHEGVQAIGALLSRRAAARVVDLKPFALMGVPPDGSLFWKRPSGRILSDFKALGEAVREVHPGGRVREFASVADYHRFLFEERLLPMDLSKGHKRSFSLLWRQATQPHLGELNNFLQQTLCHEPEKRLTFEDVEKLMQERLQTERQLKRLGELRVLTAELQAKATELDGHRRRALALGAAAVRIREERLRREIAEGEARFESLDARIGELNADLEGVRNELEAVGRERDRYMGEQSEWSRRLKHYREYTRNQADVIRCEQELAKAEEGVAPMEEHLTTLRREGEELREKLGTLAGTLAGLREREGELERQGRKWQEFERDLDRAVKELGYEVTCLADLEEAWAEISGQRQNIQELKALRQLRQGLEARRKAYEAADYMAAELEALWPELFEGRPAGRELLEEAQRVLSTEEKEIAVQRQVLSQAKAPLQKLIDELSKGRLPLPPAAARMVEQGLAAPYASHFDDLDLEEAGRCQETIGPLARAIEPTRAASTDATDPATTEINDSLASLARGGEPFWLVLSPDAWRRFRVLKRTDEGTIAACGDIAWYTPNGPVWIGAEARRQQIGKAQEELLRIGREEEELKNREAVVRQRRQAVQGLWPKLDALADTEAPHKAEELAEQVVELERLAPRVDRLFPLLLRLFQRSELFSQAGAPDRLQEMRREVQAAAGRRGDLEKRQTGIKEEESRIRRELASLRNQAESLRRDLERARTLCVRLEEEEPPEILQGRVDFGRAEELARRIAELDERRGRLQSALFEGERRNGELRNRYRSQGEALARLRGDLNRAMQEEERALDLWRRHYPQEEPPPMVHAASDERERHRVLWESSTAGLRARLQEVSRQYDVPASREEQPDRAVSRFLELLLPPGLRLDQLEEQYTRLQRELEQIELKIKSHVEEVRSTVETEVRHLRMRLVRVNRILSTLRFGKIKKIVLELDELPSYHALKKLESVLRVINRSEAMTLREFVERLRNFIRQESNISLTEEQIADYRSYVRIRRVIVDAEDCVREGGLSGGETLGVNLALCLAVLFFMGREGAGRGHREGGMLLLALDEAERLDEKALGTIRELLDDVRCQLTVAMPRLVEIPDCVCHLLTPLKEGVTHVRLYRQGEKGVTT